MHWGVPGLRSLLAIVAVLALSPVLVSGGSRSDPRTPAALAGLSAPFLPTAVLGNGGTTAGVDAYGDVVDLWVPGPAGRDLIHNPASRQAASSVPADTGIVPRVSGDGARALPLWRARSVHQTYLPGTNILRTVAQIGAGRIEIVEAIRGGVLDCTATASGGLRLQRLNCERGKQKQPFRQLAVAQRRWLGRARPLGEEAPGWARRMYGRSLLVLRALTDRQTGAVAAGTREGWAYVWPRDASAVAIALAAAGFRPEARRILHFLLHLDLGSAARFSGSGAPVSGRAAEGDATGWLEAAARASGSRAVAAHLASGPERPPWRGRADYQERSGQSGNYLANAIASRLSAARIRALFATSRGLVRSARDPGSGLDSAAAWAVRPFPGPHSSARSAEPWADWRRIRRSRADLASSLLKIGRRMNPGARRLPGALGAWRRSERGARRSDCSVICAAAPPRPGSSPSGWGRGEVCHARPPRWPGHRPLRFSPCVSSGRPAATDPASSEARGDVRHPC